MSLLREFFGPFEGQNPGTIRCCGVGGWPFEAIRGPFSVAALEDGESLLSGMEAEKMIAEKYFARRLSSIQQALVEGELDNAYGAPGTENPADGLTKVRGSMAPHLRLLEPRHFNPGSLRPREGVAWMGRGGRGKYGA